MESGIVFAQVGTFLLIMLVGVVLGRTGVIDAHTNKHLSKLLIYVSMPLMVVSSFQQMEYSASDAAYLVRVLVISVGIYVCSMLLGHVLYRRVEPRKRSVLRFALVFSNAGYIGLPLIRGLYGDQGVFYASVSLIPFNLFMWTYGVAQFSEARDLRHLKKVLLNPGIIAILTSVVLYLFSVRLPGPVVQAADMMGGMTGPLGMLIIGVLLSHSRVKELFCGWEMYAATLMRVLVLPLLVYGVLGWLGTDQTVIRILVALIAMPVAVNSAVFAEMYDGDAYLASRTVVFSTLAAMATIPLLLAIIR